MTLGELSGKFQLIDWNREIPKIIEFTLQAWDSEMAFPNSEKEDKITDHLVCALLRLQQQAPWSAALTINGQRNEYRPETNSLSGRNDIVFQLGGLRSFTWECKVLHRAGKTLYSEYRKDGMMRFVTGKYAKTEQVGGMLGYVMDNDLDKARKGLQKHFKKHGPALKQAPIEFQPSRSSQDARLTDTVHKIPHTFVIAHALLAMET